jgi:hypothetical protein
VLKENARAAEDIRRKADDHRTDKGHRQEKAIETDALRGKNAELQEKVR